MNENYLINKILRRIEHNKGFIKINDYPSSDFIYMDDRLYVNEQVKPNLTNKIKFERSNILLDVRKMNFEIDNYHLNYYILDNIILNLTTNIITKNYYFTQETVNEDLFDIINKPELQDVNWFITMDTHLEFTEFTHNFYGDKGWTDLKIGNTTINSLDCSFPKDIIFGCKYPIIINKNDIYHIMDNSDGIGLSSSIKINYYYVEDFYAIRMITDEKKKKLFLRDKKIKKLMK